MFELTWLSDPSLQVPSRAPTAILMPSQGALFLCPLYPFGLPGNNGSMDRSYYVGILKTHVDLNEASWINLTNITLHS